jgi:hypothetical protein
MPSSKTSHDASSSSRRNGQIIPHSPGRLDFHDTLPFDEQRGRSQRPMGTVRAQ